MVIEYENLYRVNKPYLEELSMAFKQVINSGWYILGNEVAEFESEFAVFHGRKHCIGVGSGLDALILSIKSLQLPPGSEIIVPSNTYIATILSIIHAGMHPVFVEPQIDSYNIDPAKIENALTKNTKAILVVHLYGRVCWMSPIIDLCEKYGLKLLEDCAQAHGARYQGKLAGTFGQLAAFSFYPTKNLGCLGDGGAILTDEDQLAERLRYLRNYGSQKKYHNIEIGYNSRLDELQAAFLRIKLKSLNKINSRKIGLASIYDEGLDGKFIKPISDPDYHHVYHIYNIRHKERDRIRAYLARNQIYTEIHYPIPPHRQQALVSYSSKKLPIAEEIHDSTLSLPISASHTAADIERTVEVINKYS